MFVKRYCTLCEKNYDFEIKKPDDLNMLFCPVCGAHVGKESRDPKPKMDAAKTETQIGKTIYTIMRIVYLFIFVMSVIGIVAFAFRLYTVLYVVTGIALVVYLIQIFTGYSSFKLGLILVPLGGVFGFLITKNVAGACLGMMAVFCIRFIIRDLLYKMLFKLIGRANKK